MFSLVNIIISLAILVAICATETIAVEPFGGVNNEAYLDWLQESSYARSAFLKKTSDEGDGVAVHWTIANDSIYLAVAARATGWVSVGFSENGSMRGSDMVIFEAASNTLTDAYNLDDLMPLVDECQSWKLLSSRSEGGFLIFEGVRALETGDNQDLAILNDIAYFQASVSLIAAWGDQDTYGYHGQNRARANVRFFTREDTNEWADFAAAMEREAEGSFLISAKDFLIPETETKYEDFCFMEEDLIAMGVPTNESLHIVGFEPIIDPIAKPYVHHYLLYASNSGTTCRSLEVANAWAPGAGPETIPPIVGTPLGESGFKSFRLNMHYNNPSLTPGVVDNSGVRIYWTRQKREFDLGLLQVGDPFVRLNNELVGNGSSYHDFYCRSECTTNFVNTPLTVIKEILHMHQTGRRMFNIQYRDDKPVHVGNAEFFDFDKQGNQNVAREPYTILPGDAFHTRCYYDSREGEVFGTSSQEEMCIGFIYYYPRQTFMNLFPFLCGMGVEVGAVTACNANHSHADISVDDHFERTYGVAPSQCPAITAPELIVTSPPEVIVTSPPEIIVTSGLDMKVGGSLFLVTALFCFTTICLQF